MNLHFITPRLYTVIARLFLLLGTCAYLMYKQTGIRNCILVKQFKVYKSLVISIY